MLSNVLTDNLRNTMPLKIMRDKDGTRTDCLHVHGHASPEEARQLEKAIWEELETAGGPPEQLGQITPDQRSEPLALTQLILLYHQFQARDGAAADHPGRAPGHCTGASGGGSWTRASSLTCATPATSLNDCRSSCGTDPVTAPTAPRT